MKLTLETLLLEEAFQSHNFELTFSIFSIIMPFNLRYFEPLLWPFYPSPLDDQYSTLHIWSFNFRPGKSVQRNYWERDSNEENKLVKMQIKRFPYPNSLSRHAYIHTYIHTIAVSAFPPPNQKKEENLKGRREENERRENYLTHRSISNSLKP